MEQSTSTLSLQSFQTTEGRDAGLLMLVHADFPQGLGRLETFARPNNKADLFILRKVLFRIVDLAVMVLQFQFEAKQFSETLETIDDTIDHFVNPEYPLIPKEDFKEIIAYIRSRLPRNVETLYYVHGTDEASYIYFDTPEIKPHDG